MSCVSSAGSVRDYLLSHRDAMQRCEPLVRADEPDSVHRMRVAGRRLRATLRTFRPLLTDRGEALRAELTWLAAVLGEVRDIEVTAAAIDHALAVEPSGLVIGPVREAIAADLAAAAGPARDRLLAALDDDRYRQLRAGLDAFLPRPFRPPARPGDSALSDPTVRRLARRAVRRADRLLGEARGPDGTRDRDDRLHEARKAVKRARYAAEAIAAAAGRPADRLARRLTDLQDLLGAQHDTVTSRERLLRWAGLARAAGDDTFTYGVLHARQQALSDRLEGQLPAAHDAVDLRRAADRLLD